MSPRDSIRKDRYAFDQRGTPRDTTQAVNQALEPGTGFTFSSELRPDLGGAMMVDNNYQTRWVSTQPQDWVKFSFTGRDGASKRYRITEYAFTSGGLGWTSHRDPLEWEVYGSNVAEPATFSLEVGAVNPDWVLLDAVTGQYGETRILPRIYSLPNTEAYAHYLFHLRNQSGGVQTELELTEIQMFNYFEHDPSIDGNQPPVPSLVTSADEVDSPAAIEFDASATVDADGDWLYYTWDFGDGHVLDRLLEGSQMSHTYYQPGTYEVVLKVTDGRGYSADISRTIVVLPELPNTSPYAVYAASSESVLVGTSVILNAGASYDGDGDALHYRWEFGDGVHAEGTVVEHTWYKPGVYNPVLVLTDEHGRKSYYYKDIEVLPPNGSRGVLSFNCNRGEGRLNPNRGAGAVSVAYWNDLVSPWTSGWYDSTGQPVDLLISSTGRHSSFSSIYPVPAFDGNARLGERSDGKTTYGTDEGFSWEVAGIPYSVYDVYVYFGGSAVSDPRAVLINGEPRYVSKQGHGYTGEWRVSEATTPEEAVPGQDLLIWRNVIGSSILLEMPTRNSDGIAGFQIIDKTGSPDAPPFTVILTPENGDWFTEGEIVSLSGTSEGVNGPLADPFLSWESSLDGFLGNGTSLSISDFSVGQHTISLTGTNEGNLSMTASVVIDIFPVPSAPTIVAHPEDITTYETATIQFAVAAEGSPPLFSYQWRRNGVALEDGDGIDGSATDTLTISGVSFGDAGDYDVVVANAEGFAVSEAAALVVTELLAPVVDVGPVGGIVDVGDGLLITAEIGGSRPMQFRWYHDGEELQNGGRISGADTDTLIIADVVADDTGMYELIATNAGGSISTVEVNIHVNLPPVITVLRPTGAVAEVPFGPGAWLRTSLADNTVEASLLQLHWTLIEGPGTVEFTDLFSKETGVRFGAVGEYVVRLSASDGSLSSYRDITVIVRDDLDDVTAPLGPPLVSDSFDWGTANLSNSQIPSDTGWRFGTNNFSYVGDRSGLWAGTGQNPYMLFGGPGSGLLRGNVQHNPRGIQRDFPELMAGQRWLSVLVRLESGWDNLDQTAVFSIGSNSTYSYGGIHGDGFGFHNDGTGLRLVALDQTTPVASAETIAPQQQWLLVIAKTTVNPDGADSISLWALNANDSFGLNETSLGQPDVQYTGFDWGAGFNNIWIGAYRPNGPTAVFEFDELRVSTEGGDRGLSQVLVEIGSAIPLGPQVAIDPVGVAEPGVALGLEATVNDLDSHPEPVTQQWLTASGPATAAFESPSMASTSVVFPNAGSYLLRLIADDGAVATFAEVAVSVSGAIAGFAEWMDTFAADIPPANRGPLVDHSGDGLLNIFAYARDIDPRLRLHGSEREFLQVQRDGSDWLFILQVPEELARPDLHYRLLSSSSLADWNPIAEAIGSTAFVPIGSNPASVSRDGDDVLVRIPISEGEQVFVRLEVLFR
jgi:hypothetical protein